MLRITTVLATALFFTSLVPAEARQAGQAPATRSPWRAADGVTVDVIADLQHLSPQMLALVKRCKGPDGYLLVSDAAPCAEYRDASPNSAQKHRESRKIHRE